MSKFLLICSLAGAIVPYFFFFSFISEHGIDLFRFTKALFENDPAAGFSSDLLITSFVFWIYLFHHKDIRYKWVYILLNLLVGLSCAFPLFLYVKLKKSKKIPEQLK